MRYSRNIDPDHDQGALSAHGRQAAAEPKPVFDGHVALLRHGDVALARRAR
ncbi:MAG: hypothetical protein IPF82_16360 [Blastocatellia bacterium]|nr:hypothetical protein [Blastocatellia bacterium]